MRSLARANEEAQPNKRDGRFARGLSKTSTLLIMWKLGFSQLFLGGAQRRLRQGLRLPGERSSKVAIGLRPRISSTGHFESRASRLLTA
jgi:hypothetical protein